MRVVVWEIAGIEAWRLGWREEKHVFGDRLKVPGKGRAVSEK
jgi:hypothetical protein